MGDFEKNEAEAGTAEALDENRGETRLEHDADAISDVAPNARLHLSKYARGRYAIVNMQGLKMGCFDDEDEQGE